MLARIDRCRRNSLLCALSWGFPLLLGCGGNSHAGEPARGGSGNEAGDGAAGAGQPASLGGGRGGAGGAGGAPLAQGGQSMGPAGSAGADDASAGAPGAGAGGEGGAPPPEVCAERPHGALICAEGATCVAGACVATACDATLELSGLPAPPVGASPYWVATGDVNGDSKDDVIVSQAGAPRVSVLLGNGNGTFAAPVEYELDSDLGSAVLGDIDSDGDVDLVVTTLNGVRTLLNHGDGTFEVAADHPTDIYATSVDLGDFDGDGHVDLVVGTAWKQLFSILHNRGDGTFEDAADHAVQSGSFGVVVRQLNGDDKPDLLITDSYDAAKMIQGAGVMLNQGDGTFASPVTYQSPQGASSTDAVTADLNHDHSLDLISADWQGNTLSVRLGNGDGTYGAPTSFPGGTHPNQVLAGDVNGDGNVDLLVAAGPGAGNGGGVMSVLLGQGDGTFAELMQYQVNATALAPLNANGDNRVDLVGTSSTSQDIAVVLGQSDGSLLVPRHFPTGHQPGALAAEDLDLDGRPDLVVSNTGGNSVSVLLATGDDAFAAAVDYPIDLSPTSIVVADVSSDGLPDVAVVEDGFFGKQVGVMVNQGGGVFATPLLYPAGAYTLGLTAADFDADGALDLATIDYQLGNINVLLNEGHGTFAAPVPHAADGPGDWLLVAADVNGDHVPDLVTFSYTRVTVLKNLGNADFAPPANYQVGSYNAGIAAVDLNRDGYVDLVVSDPGNAVVNVLLNDGTGLFAAPVSYPAGPDPFNVTATDINSDGWPDLVIGHTEYIHDYVAVLLNKRDGTLGPPIRYRAGSTATTAIAAADINRDGRPDLIAVNNDRDQVSVLQTSCLR